ncbi:MAG: DUF421 domain-containing protein [Firmicutes bacterium]|nr:DUF421 domain-containing protein [Bacillota bacterium]
MSNVILRTIIIYLTVLIVMRLMGKREVGQLSTFDLVVAIMIAEIAVFPMEELDIPIYIGLIPMFILVGGEILISYLCLKSRFLRKIIDGGPSIIISNGIILENEMRRQRYNLNDLLAQLREKGIFDISEVKYAILETSGKISVMPKTSKRPLTPEDMNLSLPEEDMPLPIIFDGQVMQQNLGLLGLTNEWLDGELKKYDLRTEEILYASVDSQGKLFISEKVRKKS